MVSSMPTLSSWYLLQSSRPLWSSARLRRPSTMWTVKQNPPKNDHMIFAIPRKGASRVARLSRVSRVSLHFWCSAQLSSSSYLGWSLMRWSRTATLQALNPPLSPFHLWMLDVCSLLMHHDMGPFRKRPSTCSSGFRSGSGDGLSSSSSSALEFQSHLARLHVAP